MIEETKNGKQDAELSTQELTEVVGGTGLPTGQRMHKPVTAIADDSAATESAQPSLE